MVRKEATPLFRTRVLLTTDHGQYPDQNDKSALRTAAAIDRVCMWASTALVYVTMGVEEVVK